MEFFLERIAKSLYAEYGNSLNRHCLVFPGRRAGLYFIKYLASSINKPVWIPSILTINELFRTFSPLQAAGDEILIFELYKVYRTIKKSPESFDDFYFWGDMLLNDFDDVDKYLADASILFTDISDIKKIDQQFGSLTEEQAEIIRRFWLNFDPGRPTDQKSGFINIWTVLNDLYEAFRKSLRDKNLAYEGMIFREVADDPGKGFISKAKWDMVHFIGFNALNSCERNLMTGLRDAGKARFYWDYDNSYIDGGKLNSAGFFLRDNLKIFGNDMPPDWRYDTLLSASAPDVHRRVIDTSSDVAQVKLVAGLLEKLPGIVPVNAYHTAVVLADENLLMPLLTSLPGSIGDINLTMGHPLKQTIVYTLVRQLMDLHLNAVMSDDTVNFSCTDVINIFENTLVKALLKGTDQELLTEIIKTNQLWIPLSFFNRSESLSIIFRRPLTPASFSDYLKDILSFVSFQDVSSAEESDAGTVDRNITNEFIYRVVLSVNRLETIVKSPVLSFTTDTYIRILDRILKSQSVPFSGEPLAGVQVMGILETRALDFKNLIILSVNEGVLPAVSAASSFIPFSLREAFGLPSVNHQESIYAYHFYRLLQRAENVIFMYNSNSEGLKSGEMSRFLIQMNYEMTEKPEINDLYFEIKTHGSISERIERKDKHHTILRDHYLEGNNLKILSPSAVNTWLNCRMKFYYRYVNRLAEPEKITADTDPALLGSFLHEIMRRLYQDYRGKVLAGTVLGSFARDKNLLEGVTNTIINEKFRKGGQSLTGGNELIVKEVLMAYVKKILDADRLVAPFTILDLEESFSFPLTSESDGLEFSVKTGGKVDRIDEAGGVTRIVDYKTGNIPEAIGSVSELFEDDRNREYDGWLQTLLYCEAYISGKEAVTVRPSIYRIRKLNRRALSDKLLIKAGNKNIYPVEDYKMVRDEFLAGLRKTVINIFRRDEPFYMTTDKRSKCSFCPYRSLCMR